MDNEMVLGIDDEFDLALMTDDFVTKSVTETMVTLVKKQDEMILHTIRQTGGNVYSEITIDESKVLEALRNYDKKQKRLAWIRKIVKAIKKPFWKVRQ